MATSKILMNLALTRDTVPKESTTLDKSLASALSAEKKVASEVIVATAPPPVFVPPPAPVPGDVAKDSALGRMRETTAVAKRLEVSPAAEFVNIARTTKQRFFVGGLEILARTGYALEDIPVKGFEVDETPAPTTETPKPALVRKPIEDAADLLNLYRGDGSLKVVDADDDQTLEVVEENEATFFSTGLDSIDSTVRFLRAIETRTDAYRGLQSDATAARDRLKEVIQRLGAEIADLDTHLAEVRHDLSVARSLRAEEIERVAQLIERRRAILAEQVPYLVFRRPLLTHVLEDSPVLPAEPGLIEDPVPAARRQTDELLPELQQMIDSLRDVPARWFRKAVPLFAKFDRVQSIERLAAIAVERVDALAAKQGPAIAFESDGSKAAQQLRKIFDTQQERVLKLALDARGQLGAGQAPSAKAALDVARRVAAVSDLVRAAPPTREVSLGTAGLLDDIGNVAQSLYERFSDVQPATRLRWAEILSELDSGIPLRQLSVLPDFGNEAIGVDFIQWRQLQQLVDWLFTQIDADVEAVAAINDLVRVCLLLSAHAPVKRILTARVKRPVPAVVDTRVELELDPKLARIGMQVLVHEPLTSVMIARAVVEDISSGGGIARVTQVMKAQQTIGTSTRVQLQAGPPLSTPAAASADKRKIDTQRETTKVAQVARQDAVAQRAAFGLSKTSGRLLF